MYLLYLSGFGVQYCDVSGVVMVRDVKPPDSRLIYIPHINDDHLFVIFTIIGVSFERFRDSGVEFTGTQMVCTTSYDYDKIYYPKHLSANSKLTIYQSRNFLFFEIHANHFFGDLCRKRLEFLALSIDPWEEGRCLPMYRWPAALLH